jgi:Ca2+-binding EF-hand superfamily protein
MTPLQKQKLLHFFHVLDHDGNGILEEEDFTLIGDNISDRIGLSKTASERLVLKVKAYGLFLQILHDIGKEEALLTPEEWLEFFEHFVLVKSNNYIHQTSNYVFALFDQDGDGYIDEREYQDMFKAYDLYTAHTKKAFDLLDLNGDGKLSHQEMVKAFSEFFLSNDPNAPGNWIFGDWTRDA